MILSKYLQNDNSCLSNAVLIFFRNQNPVDNKLFSDENNDMKALIKK